MGYQYDVTVSFAGEDRKFVLELVEKLTAKGIKVFYDNWETSKLWGENLYTYLEKIYKDRAMFCITVISHAYLQKPWTKHELKIIQERQMKEDVYWLPLFLEKVEIPGLLDTVGYVSAENLSIEEIVELICEKIEDEKIELLDDSYKNSPKTMTIVDEDGKEIVVEVVIAFEFKDTHKEYVVYSYGEKDRNNNETVYVSEVNRDGGKPALLGVESQKEWERIKEVLRELGKGEAKNDDKLNSDKLDSDEESDNEDI